MTLEECVKEIINRKFSSGDCFDSHAVINEMVKNKEWHEVYMQNFQGFSDVRTYHSHIAKLIKNQGNINKCCITKANSENDNSKSEIKSHTIYGDLVENQLWKKN